MTRSGLTSSPHDSRLDNSEKLVRVHFFSRAGAADEETALPTYWGLISRLHTVVKHRQDVVVKECECCGEW